MVMWGYFSLNNSIDGVQMSPSPLVCQPDWTETVTGSGEASPPVPLSAAGATP